MDKTAKSSSGIFPISLTILLGITAVIFLPAGQRTSSVNLANSALSAAGSAESQTGTY